MTATIKVNRAPVLTLWAAVVAERLGHPPSTAASDVRKSLPDQHVSAHMLDAAKLLNLRALGLESDAAVLGRICKG